MTNTILNISIALLVAGAILSSRTFARHTSGNSFSAAEITNSDLVTLSFSLALIASALVGSSFLALQSMIFQGMYQTTGWMPLFAVALILVLNMITNALFGYRFSQAWVEVIKEVRARIFVWRVMREKQTS